MIRWGLPGILLVTLILIGYGGCAPDEGDLAGLPYQPRAYPLAQPPGFLPMVEPADNPTTVAGVALGRQLFYDPILSADHSISCGTCHQPALAFTDGRARSQGIQGRTGQRSSPSLFNVGFYYDGIFWDGRSPSLEAQALHPVTDPSEMGNDWATVLNRLRTHPDYPAAFRAAFGIEHTQELDSLLVGKALAQFQRTLVSADSKFDRWLRGEIQLSPSEERGRLIFFDADYPNTPMAECNHCHADPLLTDLSYANNGLDYAPGPDDFSDPGRGAVTGKPADHGKFRVPTLRNIALTAPYMHDGRFATLEEVVDHYNQGGAYALNVNPNVRPLGLTPADQADLVAFLKTLTDTTALRKKEYQHP
jgi:cytochrome c peroxidase